MIDKKLTGLGTGVLGDLSESVILRQPTEGKNLREEEDVEVDKRVSRSVAMRIGDRTPARGRKQNSGKNLLQTGSCGCICEPARARRWESSIIKQRCQRGRRQPFHSIPGSEERADLYSSRDPLQTTTSSQGLPL